MGVADRAPKHGHALGWRDDEADFPIQVLTICRRLPLAPCAASLRSLEGNRDFVSLPGLKP
jgi:hypothetical protein